MTNTALADALTIAFQSIVESFPREHRRYINAILCGALRDVDLVQDVETRQIIWRLAGLPPRRPARAAEPSARRRKNPTTSRRAASTRVASPFAKPLQRVSGQTGPI